MKFTVKSYKLTKIENYFKISNFFFLANTITPKNNIKTAQELKKSNLNYYKLYNTLTKRIIKNSIFYNYQPLINGLIMIVIPQDNKNIKPRINEFIILLGVKLNNKIYSVDQIRSIIKFDFKKDYLNLIKASKVTLKQIELFFVN
jgi:hypothetical protein